MRYITMTKGICIMWGICNRPRMGMSKSSKWRQRIVMLFLPVQTKTDVNLFSYFEIQSDISLLTSNDL